MLLKNGGTLAEHRAGRSVSLQVLIGRLAIKLNGETAKISARQLLVIEREVLHKVTSERECIPDLDFRCPREFTIIIDDFEMRKIRRVVRSRYTQDVGTNL